MATEDFATTVDQCLRELSSAAQQAFGLNLKSITLYGTAAEDRLRLASDVNVLLILTELDESGLATFGPQLAIARGAARVRAMFVLENELPDAVELFAQKFSDIHRRHRVLFGQDLLAEMRPNRPAIIYRLHQVLLNLVLRLRQAYIERANDPILLLPIISEFSGPLRTCAATLRELNVQTILPPKEALIEFVSAFGSSDWLGNISQARETEDLSPEVARATVKNMLATAQRMKEAVSALGKS